MNIVEHRHKEIILNSNQNSVASEPNLNSGIFNVNNESHNEEAKEIAALNWANQPLQENEKYVYRLDDGQDGVDLTHMEDTSRQPFMKDRRILSALSEKAQEQEKDDSDIE